MSYRFRLTKKGKIVFAVVGVIVIAAIVGVTIWLVNRPQQQVAPDDSGATTCPLDDRFNTVEECVSSCESGCPGSDNPEQCVGGCPAACENLCNGDQGGGTGGGGAATGCEDNEGNYGAGCCENPSSGELFCNNGLLCCMGSCRNDTDWQCGTPGVSCDSCEATCGTLDCKVTCSDTNVSPNECGAITKTFVCDGQQLSCGDLNGSFNSGLSNNSGGVDPSNESYWCTTVQLDSAYRDGSNARIVWIGDNGEYCSQGSGCSPDDLDWDCVNAQPIPEPVPEPIPEPAPTPKVQCNESCTADSDCVGAYTCVSGACRNPICTEETDCTCPGGVPAWKVVKVGAPECVSGGDSSALVKYTITVSNEGTASGSLSQVLDTLDNKIQESWIVEGSLTEGAVVEGNTILWPLLSNGTLAVGESRTFNYTINVPKTSFGDYRNVVEAFALDAGVDNATAEANVTVACAVPKTGLFDDTKSKIIVAAILVVGSAVYMKSEWFDDKVSFVTSGIVDKYSYTERVSRKRKKFEDKIK
ncbi:DUF11 domain-containing protein [Candidatus Dojkabacteria bacterium]|uniref:DUF11 domain-containing protein n=1 Tax=Candidatus Dojkabacteria bacterium TaxID=2099670 RepID=A0A955HXE9_9BACT|nr:DUF11 domain-containing protein [Candidatus Dojkabacteria bacterium]